MLKNHLLNHQKKKDLPKEEIKPSEEVVVEEKQEDNNNNDNVNPLFAQLNQGTAITKGLNKVTKEMKTKKINQIVVVKLKKLLNQNKNQRNYMKKKKKKKKLNKHLLVKKVFDGLLKIIKMVCNHLKKQILKVKSISQIVMAVVL